MALLNPGGNFFFVFGQAVEQNCGSRISLIPI